MDSSAKPSYLALLGDLAGSRDLTDRAAVQERLQVAVQALNRLHGFEMAAELTIGGGDQVSALFLPEKGSLAPPAACAATELVLGLGLRLAPTRLCFGLGHGALSVPLAPGTPIGALDGPCFHLAHEALLEAKRRDLFLTARGLGPKDPLLTGVFALLGTQLESWTPRQVDYAREILGGQMFEDEGGLADTLAQKEVAARFGVGPSVVSETLKAIRLERFRRGAWAAALAFLGSDID
ncbi:MAG: hypothetical protein H8E31_10540 [Planctomycetes bacterium]|nr:hypothetical protein [Planctomycetota bacterium]